MKLTKKQKKQQKEVTEKLKKYWNDPNIPWNVFLNNQIIL